MKHTLPILALFTLHASLFTLPAAVPLRWTVETSRAQVAQFEAYRGETLDLEATMKSYGSPLATPVQPSLYWQTNGMGAAWWTAPATASGNVLRATWSPTNDCGGTVYNCFIGGPDATYRAAFRLRMLPSPGFTPNHIPLPTVKAESDPVFSAWLATNEFSSAGVDTNAVNDLIASATKGLADKADAAYSAAESLADGVNSLAGTIGTHIRDTKNPHKVTAAQVGAVPLVEDSNGEKTAVTIGKRNEDGTVGVHSLANGADVTASGNYSHAEGGNTYAAGDGSHAEGHATSAHAKYSHVDGVMVYTPSSHVYAYAWNGDNGMDVEYFSHGAGTYNINPVGGTDGFYIGDQTLSAIIFGSVTNNISADNPTFSNAVLAVGLNIDTNSVAVLNEIADSFGGFPIEGTATTVGGFLAALAAAVAWLKKNKVGSFASVGGASATVENGVANLDDFFTESNSLLNGRLAYSRNATGLKDRAFNTLSFDGTEFNLSTALEEVTPTASGQPRDLLIVATATAATTIGYTAGTIKGDKPTIDGSGTWLITLTEYASGVWYCRQIKMEDAA